MAPFPENALSSRSKTPGNAEAAIYESALGRNSGTVGGTDVLIRSAVPGSSAGDPLTALASFEPSRAVVGGVELMSVELHFVTSVPTILSPFPDVAYHVVQSELVGRE